MDNKREMDQVRPKSTDEMDNVAKLYDSICHLLIEQEHYLRKDPANEAQKEFVNNLTGYICDIREGKTNFPNLPKWIENKLNSFNRDLYDLLFDPEIRAMFPE